MLKLVTRLAATLIAAAFAAASALAAYPERPITLIVPWGAGGGTDATARIIGSLLEKELGQPVTVVNRTGGSGVVGHAARALPKPTIIAIATAAKTVLLFKIACTLMGSSW